MVIRIKVTKLTESLPETASLLKEEYPEKISTSSNVRMPSRSWPGRVSHCQSEHVYGNHSGVYRPYECTESWC